MSGRSVTLLSGVGASLLAALRRVRPNRGLLLAAALLGAAPATAFAVTASGSAGVETAVHHGDHPLAPVVALPQIGSSRRLSLADYRGQVVLLSFYATWCPPCVSGLPALTQLNQQLHAAHSGTVLLDVILEPSSELAHLPLRTSIPATQDPKGVLGKLFGVTEIPTAFAIDKRGRVIAFAASNSVLSLRRLRALVAQASK